MATTRTCKCSSCPKIIEKNNIIAGLHHFGFALKGSSFFLAARSLLGFWGGSSIKPPECVRWCFWLRLCLSSGVVSSIMNQNLGLAPLVLNAYPHIWSTRGFFKQHKQRCFKKPLWHQTPQKISDSASFVRRVPRFAEQSKCFHIATSASVSCSYLSRSATLGCPHPVICLV